MLPVRSRYRKVYILTFVVFCIVSYGAYLKTKVYNPLPSKNLLDSLCDGIDRNFSCPSHKDESLQFYLHTSKNPEAYVLEAGNLENLKNSSFLKGIRLKVLIHGWKVSSDGEFCTNTRNAYLSQFKIEGVNLIIVDWKEAAGFDGFVESAECTRAIAKRISNLLQFLIKAEMVNLDLIHLVGHSLGAHVGAMACSNLNYMGGCGRLTALDPARPCFRPKDCPLEFRLDPTDAQFVDVLHTDGSTGSVDDYGFGFEEPLGHVDFYPNGGKRPQPGCGSGILEGCSHSRSHELFTESVNNPAGFIARHCDNWSDFNRGKCKDSSSIIMGEHTRVHKGQLSLKTYYLKTAAIKPFALGRAGADSPPSI